MSKDIAGRKKITALTRASLLLILTFLFSPSFSENLLKCPDFEQPDSLSQCWTHLSWGSSDVSAHIVTGGYQNSNGLMMLNNDPCLICEYTRQMVGSLEPGLYGLSVLYKTSPECQAMAYIRNTGQLNIGKSKALNGTGSWNNLNVHFAVRDEYADQTWQVMLYGGLPPNSKEPVYYDKAVFEKLSLTQIEEINIGYWEKMIFRFTNGFPPLKWVPAKVSTCSAASDPNIHGEYALVLKGTKTTKELYEFDVPVRPSTKYKVGVSVKYMNRKSYNYLQSIPAYPSDYTRPFSSTLEGTKGIWSGFYDVRVYDKSLGRSYAASVLQPVISDAIYVADANRDWFSEKSYYQTGPNSSNLTMQIELTGFDGDLYIDDLTVEEVHSHIEDESLRIPISYEYEGMKITGWTLPSIKTNAAEFIFNASSIWLAKGSNVLGYLTFNSNFLASLAVDTTASGLVILKNGNITVSIGADSSMIVRLEKDTNVTVSGVMPPKFHNFDAGAVFVSDYEKGFLFSPVFPDLNIRTMGRLLNPPYANADVNILDFRYSDNDIDAIGLKCWDNRPVFTNPIWKVTYRFTAGDGFLASVFPPKDFNYKKYASERMHAAFDLNLNIFPNGDYRYLLTKFRERFNILLLWMGSYNLSSPHPACPMVYYTDSNGVAVSPVAPNAAPVKFIHNDVAGPYKVSQPAALDDVVARARNMGLRIILYMSPNYFYTSDLDTFFENLTAIINRYNLDGVYFDGYVSGSPLKTLELVRKARNILKNKYYAQHSSWTNTLIYQSDHFRVPFYDAYADLIYTGENLRKDYSGDTKTWDLACQPDPNAWALLYCGRNLSNTPTVLIGEYRPVDYSNLNTGPDVTLSPRTQMDYQLKYQGIFRVWPFTSYCSINDFLYRKTLSFDSSGWWKAFDNLCLNYTINDGQADPGESIYTAQGDCAPVKDDAPLIKYGNTREYLSGDSLSQWFINGKPLYRFHYNFDGEIAAEDSDSKMNPSQFLGMLSRADSNYAAPDANFAGPFPSVIDGRKTFYFDGTAKLFGEHNEQLRFMDGSNRVTEFSSFAVVRRDSTISERRGIFNLNKDSQHFSYGFYKNRFYIRVRDSDYKIQDFYSNADIDQNWHTVGLAYGGTNLAMYIDGVVIKVIPVKLAPFPAVDTFVVGSLGIGSPGFKGWIDDLFVTDKLLTNRQILEYHQTVGKTLTVTDESEVDCILIKNGEKYTAARSVNWAFRVTNGSGDTMAGFDASGNLLLRGVIVKNSLPVISDIDEFRVQDSGGSEVAIIDSNSGNMRIKGSVYQNQAILSSPVCSCFVICDNNGNVCAYIDEQGNLYLSGKSYENTDISSG